MFDFNKDAFLSSDNIVDAIARSSNSERRIKKTSINELGYVQSTLTTTDIGEALTGALYTRNIFYSQNFIQKNIQSSLDSVVSSFLSNDEISIESPEGYGTLSGSLAASRILGESILFKKGFENFAGEINQDISRLINASTSDYQSSFELYGNSAATSAGSMPVALESILTERQILDWYRQRHIFLGSRMEGEFDAPRDGFDFKLGNTSSEESSRNVTISNFPGSSGSGTIDPFYSSEDIQKAFLSASLMELLIFLEKESGLILGGSFGLSRASNPNLQNSTFQGMTDGISDHVFGRAFDIHRIARRGNALQAINQDSSIYRQQLEIFLESLNTVPEHLMPDLIVIHPGLAPIYEITSGFENQTTAIKRRYTRLRYVDFEVSEEHKTHIHIGFSGERAGVYTGPNGRLIQVPTPAQRQESPYRHTPYVAPELSQEDIRNWYRNYISTPSATISNESLFELLRTTIMTDESAALFVGIVGRESGLRPVAINGGWRQSSGNYSGEYSIGLFQVNLLARAHGSKNVRLTLLSDSYQVPVWTLGCRNHPQFSSLSLENVDNFYRNTLGKINQSQTNDPEKVSYADANIWIPYNQVSLLYTTILGPGLPPFNPASSEKLDPTTFGGHIFSAWGDYGGGLGFLHRVDYNIVIQTYLRTGKSEEQFQNWFKSWFYNTSIVDEERRARNINANNGFIQRINSAPANPSYYAGPSVTSARSIPFPTPRTIGEIAVNIAYSQILKPYETGQNFDNPPENNNAFDCSGLMRYAWYQAIRQYNQIYNESLSDIILPTHSYYQFTTNLTTPISLDNQRPENVLKPGDLIVRRGHVAMYMGGSQMIHALNVDTGIVVDNWSTNQRFDGLNTIDRTTIAPGDPGFWNFKDDTRDPEIFYARVLDFDIVNPLPSGGFQG